MLIAISILLACQLAGEIASQFFRIPIPGPVIGMVLLLFIIHGVPAVAEMLRETSNTILRHLSLLFVPAGIGVMLHARTVINEWLAIGMSLLVGTAITLVATATAIRLTMYFVRGRRGTDD